MISIIYALGGWQRGWWAGKQQKNNKTKNKLINSRQSVKFVQKSRKDSLSVPVTKVLTTVLYSLSPASTLESNKWEQHLTSNLTTTKLKPQGVKEVVTTE